MAIKFKIYDFMKHLLKFIYSEKATKFCEISTLIWSYVVPVKSKVEISQNFVAFSEHMNFNQKRNPTIKWALSVIPSIHIIIIKSWLGPKNSNL